MGNKKSKLTKTEFVKQVQESMSCGIRLNTNAYDLNENGGFQKGKGQSGESNFSLSIKL
jgi:hypothetical protein